MPTIYRNGDSVKVTAPKEFIDRITNAEAAAIADAKVANMKLNLSSKEYKEMFSEWERLKQESSQRLQRIEQQQLSLSQHKQRNQQLQQMRMQQRTACRDI
jgi:hypothetical protein